MGSYTSGNLLPFLTIEDLERAKEIMERTVKPLLKEVATPYKGVLYGGFMATEDGVCLLEFNVRFGDPEAINVLLLMEGDFAEVVEAVAEGKQPPVKRFRENATVCKYFVPEGYPINPVKSARISVNEKEIEKRGIHVYWGSVDEKNGELLTTSSRTVALVAEGSTPWQASDLIESVVVHVKGPLYHRRDIGSRGLIEGQVKKMAVFKGKGKNS